MTDFGKMYRTSEVAKIFDVTDETVRDWLTSGQLKGLKIGRGHYWRIPESSVRELAQSRYGDNSDAG